MYRRLILVSVIIFLGLCGLCALGYYSIGLHAEGLAARRANEFVAVAEQIRLDVKNKLDAFIQSEQDRSYTDYQYFYVPVASNYAAALVRSPLAESMEHGLAYGHFQIDSGGTIESPYNPANEIPSDAKANLFFNNVKDNVLTALGGDGLTLSSSTVQRIAQEQRQSGKGDSYALDKKLRDKIAGEKYDEVATKVVSKKTAPRSQGASGANRRGQYRITSLDENPQKAQVYTRDRLNVYKNIDNSAAQTSLRMMGQRGDINAPQRAAAGAGMESQRPSETGQLLRGGADGSGGRGGYGRYAEYDYGEQVPVTETEMNASANSAGVMEDFEQSPGPAQAREKTADYRDLAGGSSSGRQGYSGEQVSAGIEGLVDGLRLQSQLAVQTLPQPQGDRTQPEAAQAEEKVQIRVEPFVPIVVGGADEHSEFGGQVFLLRHVQIEQRHLLQGFKLNESELVREVAESARIGVFRRDMGFDVGCDESPEAVHTATLDFGFGKLILNLFELKPGLIAGQVSNLKRGFFAIVGVVFVAVMLAQVSLWRTAREHIRLARKKDDFISAVSHELRTPLTTIRMHTEMLEKGWIRNESRRGEYYTTMRQESERLSRLIENVLDFSRIQRGSKKYNFRMGDINECVSDVIDMMAPCASQAGFAVEKDFGQVPQFAFDADAVMQIVINLMDNAVKYSYDASEKLICVRTRCENGYVLIEVEDHGPGVPRMQRQKVFDEFYRCGDEARRETTGTGLGLALVKRFAQAHNGFVEILTAKPTGAIFRVGLVTQQA